jgi:hypothetical protein
VFYAGASENLMGESRVKFQIELDREEDGRWIAETFAQSSMRSAVETRNSCSHTGENSSKELTYDERSKPTVRRKIKE